ncbi:hypothetical protein GCM10022256_28790 [Frondihabitans peucedani]|uniref:Uncharacterized protein n=1 Tax=Frondihabitans peucedani TaxID=598626 RepID=A0ABP8E4X8_9MICO
MGWVAEPCRTSAPVSASRITTLQLWVDESMPATSVIAVPFEEHEEHEETLAIGRSTPPRRSAAAEREGSRG